MIKERVDIKLDENRNIILVKPLWDYPIVRGAIVFHNGAYLDNEEKSGLSSVFYDLLNERQDINEKLERVGAKVTASSMLTKSFVYFSFLSARTKRSFDFLHEFLNRVEFDERKLEFVKRKRLDRLAIQEEDPEYIISRKIQQIVYSNSLLANAVYGTREGIQNVEMKDIEEFYKNVYKKSRIDIIVVASSNYTKVRRYLEEMADLFTGEFVRIPDVKDEYRPEELVIKKKNIVNAYVSFFTPVPALEEEYFLSLKILSYILGEGSFNARLLKRLREELGLVYYASSGLNRGFVIGNKKVQGYLDIIAETARDKAELVAEEIKRIRDNIIEKNVSSDELELAKNYYIGLERKRGETYRDVVNTFLTERIYGLEKNYYLGLVEKIRKISLKDMAKAMELLKAHRFSRITLEAGDE